MQEKLRELVQLRDHYVEQLQHEQTYQQTLQRAVARQLADAHSEQLTATVKTVEKQLEALLDTEAPELHVPIQTLCLVKGRSA